ncbi:hypothetical protein KSS87_004088 [Heliosperma pusillum]|nr:hypothetical protein KSS87_004088 [Heliosperma pusillum]
MIMALEEYYNSTTDSTFSRDSDTTTPPCYPLHRRPQLLIIIREELGKIKSGDAEAIQLKDYVDWFMSVRAEAEVDENNVFWPQYYGRWFSTLETEAKANYFHPFEYNQWYAERFNSREPNEEFPDMAVIRAARIERCGQLALEYFNNINKCDDYEYVRDVAIRECDDSYHLNFYGRLKVSPAKAKPEPELPCILFFADVDFEDEVLECCILDSEEFGDAGVLHPPDTYCEICHDLSAPMCYSCEC